MTDHSDRGTTPVPSSSTTSKIDPPNPARVFQHQIDDTDPGMVLAYRRAQTGEIQRRLTKPRILSAATGSSPIRPPLPSPEDIRSRIPPQGISPSAVSASFGNMIVGRGIFRDRSRRQQFWDLVIQNANYDRKARLLSPLYNGAYQGLPSPPPLPSAGDIRARISSEGIYAEHLSASYGDYIMGTGMYTDTERTKQIDSLIHANAILVRKTMLLRLAPRMPTAAELQSKIPPQGITMGDFARYYHSFGWSKEREQVLQQLMLENMEFEMKTKLFFVKEPGAGIGEANFLR